MSFFTLHLVQFTTLLISFISPQNGFLSAGSMSDYIVGMRVVSANGTLLTYTQEDHPDKMAALRLCLGMCGVIYDVTFKVAFIRSHTYT